MTTPRPRLVLSVDTGTDDAAALVWASTCPQVELVAVLTGWGNTSAEQATANTLQVLEETGCRAPVHVGLGVDRAGPRPVPEAGAPTGSDGLAGLARPPRRRRAEREAAVDALLRLTREAPARLTLVALGPLTTVAAALAADPRLPGRLAGVTVMGGSVAAGGNLTAAAEANVGNDPAAAASVVDAFGAPDALADGATPRLVPLDVCLAATIGAEELDEARESTVPGAALLADLWRTSWHSPGTGHGGSGHGGPGHPVYDLLAVYSAAHPEICRWHRLPLAVDTAGGPAWGATVADRRAGVTGDGGPPGALWEVALGVDAFAFRAALRRWLAT